MRIVIFHPVRLPPRDYGGTERVVLWLSKGLAELGHEVSVVAEEGSILPDGVRLIPAVRPGMSPEELPKILPVGVGVVHFMAPPAERAIQDLPCPSVLTVHGNGKKGEVFPKNSVFLSRDHASRHGAEVFVYNGIDPAEYLPEDQVLRAQRSSFVFLSKTSWRVKNLASAMRFCAKAAAPLRIAGGSRPWGLRLLSALHPRFEWVGSVSGPKKAELLGSAKALVFPVRWPEPFGLVVAEALISGAPVLASRRGSLPELVSADVGAVLDPDDPDSWTELLRKPKLPWSPERCRHWALENFHYLRMAERYVELYRRVASGVTLHAREPLGQGWEIG